MATFAELAQVEAKDVPKHDGESFLSAVTSDAPPAPRRLPLYWEFYEQGTRQAVRWQDWKAVRQPMFTGKTELYNLKSDLSEATDLAAKHPDVVKRLEAVMGDAHTPPEPPSAAEREKEG